MARDIKQRDTDATFVEDMPGRTSEAPGRPTLVCIAGGPTGERWSVEPETSIGRGDSCTVQIKEVGISRHHATIRLEDGEYRVSDNDSTNGTYINGEAVRSKALRDGDRLQLGRTVVFKFHIGDDVDSTFVRSMYESAIRDGLTKLHNREFFEERLAHEITYAYKNGIPLSVLALGIDGLKSINDTHGRPVGDAVIKVVAEAISLAVASDHLVARDEGDNFIVLARNTDARGALELAETIRIYIREKDIPMSAVTIKVTLSAGTASLSEKKLQQAGELIARAESALSSAKDEGRDRTVQLT